MPLMKHGNQKYQKCYKGLQSDSQALFVPYEVISFLWTKQQVKAQNRYTIQV